MSHRYQRLFLLPVIGYVCTPALLTLHGAEPWIKSHLLPRKNTFLSQVPTLTKVILAVQHGFRDRVLSVSYLPNH